MIESTAKTIVHTGRFHRLLPLMCALISAEPAYAVQGMEFVAPPKYNLTDRYSVNHFSGEVSLNVDTVSIGGERGLSHSVTARTNLFTYPGNMGFTDKFAAALRLTTIGKNVAIEHGGPKQSVLWVMRATALGDSADFLVMHDGEYWPNRENFPNNWYYEAIGDTRHTLKVQDGSRVWTKPDGTRVYFGGGNSGPDNGASASRIVYPNGFTINLHKYKGATTNTGFQLKFEYVDDDPGLAPDKQGREFPGEIVPSVSFSDSAQWRTKNPRYVYGINRAVEYCDATVKEACDLEHNWPKATFHWPGGMPRAIFIDETTVVIENAAGGEARLHYEAFDAARYDVDEPDSVIEHEDPNTLIAPRLVAYTPPGADKPSIHYTYKNHFKVVAAGDSSSLLSATRKGKISTAQGIMGQAAYPHDKYRIGRRGQYGVSVFIAGGGVSAEVSTVLPGTLHSMVVDDEYNIYSFEPTYRNFPKEVEYYNGPTKVYEYDDRGNVESVEHLPDIDGQDVVYTADHPNTCNNPKTCNKPRWVKDARGYRTDYTYHPESGQIATVKRPPDRNGIRPVTRYYYDQLYAYYKKDGESVEKADTPIWLLTRKATCRTTQTTGDSCAGGAVDEVVTEYDYGPQDGTPNNLQRRGVSVTAADKDGQLRTRTTCYEYDMYGNRIGETSPKGVSAGGCP